MVFDTIKMAKYRRKKMYGYHSNKTCREVSGEPGQRLVHHTGILLCFKIRISSFVRFQKAEFHHEAEKFHPRNCDNGESSDRKWSDFFHFKSMWAVYSVFVAFLPRGWRGKREEGYWFIATSGLIKLADRELGGLQAFVFYSHNSSIR